MTHQERFAEACKVTDFENSPGVLGGYKVWAVDHFLNDQREEAEGPYFTEAEAQIAAALLQSLSTCARAYVSNHSSAWNPNEARERAIREDAMASRMILAEWIGAGVPHPGAAGASRA